jgi:hypothetical protein
VTQNVARTLFLLTLAALGFGLLGQTLPDQLAASPTTAAADRERVVFVAGEMKPEELLTLTAAAGAQEAVVLLDSAATSPYTRAFLAAYRPSRVVPVGSFPAGVADLERRLNVATAPAITWQAGQPAVLWRDFFARAEHVVVCPTGPRRRLLQAACLAGTVGGPLFLVHGDKGEGQILRDCLARWHTRTVYTVADTGKLCAGAEGVTTFDLPGEREVAAAHLKHLLRDGPVKNLVVANADDNRDGATGMSILAPYLAVQKHAPLLLTNAAGTDVESLVQAAVKKRDLHAVDALVLVADLKAIPVKTRANPIPTDKDKFIEMEPFTPDGLEPFSFAIGRLFHQEPGVFALLLARERLLTAARTPRKVLVASNSGGSLPLLETVSRNTVKEFRNAGYETTALFGKDVTRDDLRRLLPEHDVFLWEGHHNTLICDWEFPKWDESLPPSLVFLQSCLALAEWKTQRVLRRGAVAIVGSSTRVYSASGAACSLAFFDGLLYDNQPVGGALRQAKNFLIAYAKLKEKRLGKDAQRTGANLRSAWAFTLWGDPTLHLPSTERPANSLDAISHEVHGKTIVLKLPEVAYDKVSTSKYKGQMFPNGRLAGLITKDKDEDLSPLVPFVFAEVKLPKGPAGQTPTLHSRIPSSHWVFCWDGRRRCGYLLVTPRAKDGQELRFHVEWGGEQAEEKAGAAAGE